MTFPAVIELNILDGGNGFVINGINPDDRSGYSVSNAGDINADGMPDFLIGAYGADPQGRYGAGSAYMIFGSPRLGDGGVLELSSLNGTNGFVINGVNTGEGSGFSVSDAGDVNNDGIPDVLIGARNGYPGGRNYAGSTYVVFGGSQVGGNGVLELSSLDGSNGFVINGVNADEESGFSVSAAGDVNGDGVDDVLIGAPEASPGGRTDAGSTYVVFGSSQLGSGGTLELSTLDGANGFVIHGVSPFDRCGFSVSSAGDVNADGVDDLIVGAATASIEGTTGSGGAGIVYVVFGDSQLGSTGALELSSLDATNGLVLYGTTASYAGTSVSTADINADGIDDLLIGAPAGNQGTTDAGNSYVVFGGSQVGSGGVLELADLNGTDGFVLHGVNPADRAGSSISNAGDVNHDGIDDLLIGASNAAPGGQAGAGSTYVVFGDPQVGSSGVLELANLDGITGFALHSMDGFAWSGKVVSNAGDLNADGVDDFLIGAPEYYGGTGNLAGRTYVVFGRGVDVTLEYIGGDEFLISDSGNYFDGEYPSVASLLGGGFVATWRDLEPDSRISGRLFDSLGAPMGAEFPISTGAAQNRFLSATVALTHDTFVTTWENIGQDGDGYDIYGQLFNVSGIPIGGEFQVNNSTISNQRNPSIARLADDGFVITWESLEYSPSAMGNINFIRGQQFDALAMRVGNEFQVSDEYRNSHVVTGLSGGGFLVITKGFWLYGQRFDELGQPVGNEFQVNADQPNSSHQLAPYGQLAITNFSGGGFVLVYEDRQATIVGQRLDESGLPVGNYFQLVEPNYTNYSLPSIPSVAGLGSDEFVLTWRLERTDSFTSYGQRFNALGESIGSELQINIDTTLSYSAIPVVALPDDAFVAVWKSDSPWTYAGITGRIFSGEPSTDMETARSTALETAIQTTASGTPAETASSTILSASVQPTSFVTQAATTEPPCDYSHLDRQMLELSQDINYLQDLILLQKVKQGCPPPNAFPTIAPTAWTTPHNITDYTNTQIPSGYNATTFLPTELPSEAAGISNTFPWYNSTAVSSGYPTNSSSQVATESPCACDDLQKTLLDSSIALSGAKLMVLESEDCPHCMEVTPALLEVSANAIAAGEALLGLIEENGCLEIEHPCTSTDNNSPIGRRLLAESHEVSEKSDNHVDAAPNSQGASSQFFKPVPQASEAADIPEIQPTMAGQM